MSTTTNHPMGDEAAGTPENPKQEAIELPEISSLTGTSDPVRLNLSMRFHITPMRIMSKLLGIQAIVIPFSSPYGLM
jgi:hypothetical protein